MVKTEKIAGTQRKVVVQEGLERQSDSNNVTGLGSPEVYSGGESGGQTSSSEPRSSKDDIERAELGPRGEPGKADPARTTHQREAKTPRNDDPGHIA